jgi:hypothetical protein
LEEVGYVRVGEGGVVLDSPNLNLRRQQLLKVASPASRVFADPIAAG